jgi:hypothetical protein
MVRHAFQNLANSVFSRADGGTLGRWGAGLLGHQKLLRPLAVR